MSTILPSRKRGESVLPSRVSAHPRDAIQNLITRFWTACGLLAFVEIGVADCLANERRRSTKALAKDCRVDPDALGRLLAALAPQGLVAAEAETGAWYLCPAGERLINSRDDSLRSAVWTCGHPDYRQMLQMLPELVTSGTLPLPDFYSPRTFRNTAPGEEAESGQWEPQMPHAGQTILSMIRAFGDFGALLVAAEQRWADHLSDGALSVTELAERVGAEPGPVAAIAKALIGIGILTELPEDRYQLTEAGHTLRYGRPDSMRPAILMNAHPVWWDAIWNLTHVVQRGQPFLPPPHTSAYDVLRQDPDAQNLFDLFMSRRSAPVAYALGEWAATAAVPDGATFVDVGGGRGTLLAALLTALPTCRGVLLDRPVVIAQARTYLADHNVADRCEMSGGDFFAAIPQGGHTYVLGSVLHNLGDAAALHLLQLIRAAMTDGSAQLLCVDVLLPDGPQPHVGLGLLLRMMSLFPGGHERTITEYVALLHKAGFAVAATSSLPHGLSLVVARPTLS